MTDKPIILFGGKGGVGKTTCSAAVAAYCAARGENTIVITSDMTPSLSDIFEVVIGDAVKRIDNNLSVVEISQDAIVARWKQRFSRDFYDILSRLIDVDALDGESRHQLLDYIGSAPSLREETMLDLIVDMVEQGNYERVVWDTAPAGETLNLLDMPRSIRKHLRAGAKVFEGLDRIGKQLIGRRSIADTMDEWIMLSEKLARFIREKTTFVIVANPEALVVKHVIRLLKTLTDYALPIHGMVVNCVIENADSDTLRAMERSQQEHLPELRGLANGLPVAFLPRFPRGITGRKALRAAGEILCRQLEIAR
jgi:arsenite-transporting ATPase